LFGIPIVGSLQTGCASIPTAPPGSVRTELEVRVTLSDSFRARIVGADTTLERVVLQAVLQQADVGLRFYAVESSRYSADDKHPEHLLTVHLHTLDYSATPGIDAAPAEINRLQVGLEATVERRRESGPALPVARSVVKGSVRPGATSITRPVEASYFVTGEDGTMSLTDIALQTAVRRAVTDSLTQMLPAIDRELR
jgi:hypothetical protein